MEARVMLRLAAMVAVVLVVVFVWPRQRPECPNHSSYPLRLGDSTYDTLPLAGAITAIPEFHDCQRLLGPRGHQYGPLAGVWVAKDVASRGSKLGPLAVVMPGGNTGIVHPLGPIDSSIAGVAPTVESMNTGEALAFAIIYAWDGEYQPLGIKRGWNCLYLHSGESGKLLASMIPVKEAGECTIVRNGPTLERLASGTPPSVVALDVEAFRDPSLGEDDYPPVGRWDWDSGRHLQYIGLRCGLAWCEVTPKGGGKRSSPAYAATDVAGPRASVFSVKGWYDEQHLAVKPFLRKAQPSTVVGTVVPDPNLGSLDKTSFDAWQPVGQVGMTDDLQPYAKDYGFRKAAMPQGTASTGLAQVSICHGTDCFPDEDNPAPSCQWDGHEKNWWSRVISPTGERRYRCINRVDHSGTEATFPIPATARWWWVSYDEKTWFRCGTACCTMD